MNSSADTYATPVDLRRAVRARRYTAQTSGQCRGYTQGNLAVLPRDLAEDFRRYCEANPKPCPIIGMSAPGDPRVPRLGQDLDIRTDLPSYCVWRDGEYQGDVDDLHALWRDDLVAFVIGCSFSFEEALMADGIRLRHIEAGKNVAMWRTNRETSAVGPFGGPLIVSMRPIREDEVERAIAITGRFPDVHGAPVHIGDPHAIGITDINRPDFGDSVDILPGEVPVFWACGVTPQSAIRRARPPLAITHKPGCMLVTDVRNDELAVAA
ncbi:MAG: putative hydro-lyase [Burkholderiales bacterium]|nr:putative hydro-lyase [Burkholderiales bacterium]